MEGLSYQKHRQDISTRNDQMDPEGAELDQLGHRHEETFTRTIKPQVAVRNNSINNTPKLIGLSKLVRVIHWYIN
jgi:hypothetical protein